MPVQENTHASPMPKKPRPNGATTNPTMIFNAVFIEPSVYTDAGGRITIEIDAEPSSLFQPLTILPVSITTPICKRRWLFPPGRRNSLSTTALGVRSWAAAWPLPPGGYIRGQIIFPKKLLRTALKYFKKILLELFWEYWTTLIFLAFYA